ncbi:protein with P-loop containing nucleoside triphosphate hydrolase domain [Klebsormidium nitens]|uniref:Protein with P-loop containing nucleoside triphosphate hydrolase domain n=1 Tax=Klebsormidium nitens TaxID=105231 RepID=A0A1Y1IHE5_KLENI|nr:protein with P-loop containing nucleoside triphosphate hydrolase domain [Klebsormidium nitens]|eukprot:GAQ88481.1 protein with P-loop containing nucleoside triphosphate hydrolase domain [Klebsormidium nitens]
MAAPQMRKLSLEEAAPQRKDLERRWNLLEDAAANGSEDEETERAKEQWFLDALLFLAKAPLEQHSWCQFSDLSSLALESFYHYYSNPNQALSLVWQRWCQELRSCDSCVHTYQRSKEELREEFDGGPATEELFSVLDRLDQERVSQQLKEIKALFEAGNYDPEQSADLIFPTIYEVLNYPAILEDAEVDRLVAPVLSFMDQVHAISIGEYRPAGIYSLLFHNSPEGRAVATRLAKTTPPFRDGQELEIVQPILHRKVALLQQLAGSAAIHVDGGGQLPEEKLAIFGGRPARPTRVQEHLPLWLGLSTFLELLEPAAMLGGLVERHPDVVSTVLNQASEPGNPAFNVALKCLKLLFQGVGYRLWWDTDFTPKVVRSTLVSHCNTSRKENLHLTIFQLFEPFLQSLEVDRNTSDEFYDERETLLKFLTKQVANSASFSGVVKSKGLEVAFRIIQRGYTLVPPMPPSDLTPFWAPPLVASLNNPATQETLRTQAVELMSTIVVFDSSALCSAVFPPAPGFSGASDLVAYLPGSNATLGPQPSSGQEPLEVLEGQPAESGWGAEWATLETAAGSYAKEHFHPPALWQALFLAAPPVNFPGLLTKAVLWAATRLALLEEAVGLNPDQTAADGAKDWPFVVVENDGKKVSNVVEASREGRKDLVVLYRRCTAAYLDHLRQRSVDGDVAVLQALEWETWIAESLIILLLDPTALIRNADREVLKYFTADATLDGGLRTLCADAPAARAVSEGIFKASEKLLHMGFPKCSRGSQLLCFYASKLLRINSSNEQDAAEGSTEHVTLWAIACARIAEGLWPLLLRVLEGSRPAAESFEPGPTAQGLLPVADYLISASLFQRLIVHVFEAFVATWPFIRHRALPGAALGRPSVRGDVSTPGAADVSSPVRARGDVSRAPGFGSPARTPSVFDLVEGGRLKPPGHQGDEWLVDFVKWGDVTRPAVRRRWMECIELVGCEMVDAGARLPAAARGVVRDLLAPTSSLSDEQRLVLSQFFPHEAPGNLGQSALDSLPSRPAHASPPKPAFPLRQPSFETPPRSKAPTASQSRLTTSFLEGGSPPAPAGFFQPPPTAVPPKSPAIVIDLEEDDQPLSLRRKEAPRAGNSRRPIDLETESDSKSKSRSDTKTFVRTPAQTQSAEASTSGRESADKEASKMAASLAAFANRASSRPSPWSRNSDTPGGSRSAATPTNRTPPAPNRTSPMYSKRAPPRYPQQVKIDSMLSRQREEEELERVWAAADGLGGFGSAGPGKRKTDSTEASRKRESDSKPAPVKSPTVPMVPGGSAPQPERPTNRGGGDEGSSVHSRGVPVPGPKVPQLRPAAPRKTMRIELPGEGQTASARARMRRFGSHAPPGPPPKPDDWYKKILAMDFFRVVGTEDADEGLARPPNEGTDRLVQVPDRFESASQYAQVFRPLLMEEFKAQLQRVHDESGSSSNSEMLEVGHFKLLSLARRDDFWDANFVAGEDAERNVRECSELDLLLLTKHAPSKGDPSRIHVLAKVDRRDQRDSKGQRRQCTVLVLKLFLPINEPRLLKVKQLLTDGSKWHATKLFSMVPQMREFQAMSAFHTLPMVSTLLNPSSAKPRSNSSNPSAIRKLPEPLQKHLLSRYNESQQAAIASATDSGGSHNQRLTLIQGPPGTGKTSTIMGILSALLSGPGGNVTRAERVPGGLGANRPVKAPVKLSEREESAILTAQAQRAWQQAEEAKELMAKGEENGNGLAGGVQLGGEGAPRILLCAQSNAAVDELVARLLKSGVWGADGLPVRPSIVRIGNARTIHPDSRPVHIDTLVEAETRSPSPSDGVNKPASEDQKRQLRNSLVKISSEMSAAQKKSAPSGGGADGPAGEGEEKLKKTLDGLYQKRKAVQSEIIALEAADRKTREQERAKRSAVRRKILRDASIVVTTLSGCWGDVYSACKESKGSEAGGLFDAVIIDEAAQALEPATLIPLQLLVPRGGRCIMIGDPKQLPATVLSRAAANFNYERSLFERLQRGGLPVTLLSAQYRMHPEIRQFPSAHFYGGLLTDGEGISRTSRLVPFHERPVFGPYVFFDVVDGQERSRGGASSLSNDAEATAVFELYQGVRRSYPGENLRGRVGIITPYKQQLEALKRKFREVMGDRAMLDVEFNTVDGFQGREVDVLILSTVRTGGIGFVADVRRMNVALTRARNSLWIVGNSAALKRNPHWAALLSDAAGRGLVFEARRPYSALFTPAKGAKKALAGPSKATGVNLGSDEGKNVNTLDVQVGSGGKKGEKRPAELIPLGRSKKPKTTEASPLSGVKRKPEGGSLEMPVAKASRSDGPESSKVPDVKYTPLVDDSEKAETKVAAAADFLKAVETPVAAVSGSVPKGAPVDLSKAPKKSILKNALSRLEAAGGALASLNLPPAPTTFSAGVSPAKSTPGSAVDSVFSRPVEVLRSSPMRPAPLEIPLVRVPSSLRVPDPVIGTKPAYSRDVFTPPNTNSQQQPAGGVPEAPDLPPGFEQFAKVDAMDFDGAPGFQKRGAANPAAKGPTGAANQKQEMSVLFQNERIPRESLTEPRNRELPEELRQDNDGTKEAPTPRGIEPRRAAVEKSTEARNGKEEDERKRKQAETLSVEEEKARRNRENAKRYDEGRRLAERIARDERLRKENERYERQDSKGFREPKERPSKEGDRRERSRERGHDTRGSEVSPRKVGSEPSPRDKDRDTKGSSKKGSSILSPRERATEASPRERAPKPKSRAGKSERSPRDGKSEPSPRMSSGWIRDERKDRERDSERTGELSRSDSWKRDERSREKEDGIRSSRDAPREIVRARGSDRERSREKSRDRGTDQRSRSVDESPGRRGRQERDREGPPGKSPRARDDGERAPKDLGTKGRASVERSPRGSGKESRSREVSPKGRRKEEKSQESLKSAKDESGSGGQKSEGSVAVEEKAKVSEGLSSALKTDGVAGTSGLRSAVQARAEGNFAANQGVGAPGREGLPTAERGLGANPKSGDSATKDKPRPADDTQGGRREEDASRGEQPDRRQSGEGSQRGLDREDKGPSKSGGSRNYSGERLGGDSRDARRSPEPDSRTKPIPCRYFPKCDKGDACRFAHVQGSKPCRFFLMGKCREGEACRFAHPRGEEPGELKAIRREPPKGRAEEKAAVTADDSERKQEGESRSLKSRSLEKANSLGAATSELVEPVSKQETAAQAGQTKMPEAVGNAGTAAPKEKPVPTGTVPTKANDVSALAERKRLREEAAALMPAGAFRSQSARLAPASVQTAYAMPRSSSDIGRRKTLPLEETRIRGGTHGELPEMEEGEVRVAEEPGVKEAGELSPAGGVPPVRGAGQGIPPGRAPVHARLSLPGSRVESQRDGEMSPGMRRQPVVERLGPGGLEARMEEERMRFEEMRRMAMREDMHREGGRRQEIMFEEARRGEMMGAFGGGREMLVRDEREMMLEGRETVLRDEREVMQQGRREVMMQGARMLDDERMVLRDERDFQGSPRDLQPDLRELLRRRNAQGIPGAQGGNNRPISERLLGGPFSKRNM